MGPSTLFDKSFIQSLNIDESVWFDNFYLGNISPLFFVETLADLDKEMKSGKSSEQVVKEIASKTPERSSVPNVHHTHLIVENLLGHKIDLFDNRPHIAGGIPIESDGEKGVRFELSPEAEAFQRWQDEKFYELEKDFAKEWRDTVKSMTFEFSASYIKNLGIDITTCKNTNDAYTAANKLVSLNNQPQFLASLLITFAIPQKLHLQIIQRYQSMGLPSLSDFAPYVAHVAKIDIFFYISVARGFISGERPSNKIDMSYLYYLPFCNIFISGDRLHKNTAHFFMTSKQQFVWAPDLKADLNQLNVYYNKLPQEQKDLGLYAIASHPPLEGDFITRELWDKYLPNWRSNIHSDEKPRDKSESDQRLLEQLKRHAEAPEVENANFDEDTIMHMTLNRSISKQKGNWYQLPKDLKH